VQRALYNLSQKYFSITHAFPSGAKVPLAMTELAVIRIVIKQEKKKRQKIFWRLADDQVAAIPERL
jgi:hypothetical protein